MAVGPKSPSLLPLLPEGGDVSEASTDPEGDAETLATEEKLIEEDSSAESFHSVTSLPSAHSQGEAAQKQKRKRPDTDEDSEASSTSQPQLVQPIRSIPPPQLNLFELAEDISS